MDQTKKKNNDHDDLEFYADGSIASKNAPIPIWLKFLVVVLPFWGIFTFYTYWNGSQGWLDRGYWHQLQEAANTTYPYNNVDK